MEISWDQISRSDWQALSPRGFAMQHAWAYGDAMCSLGAGVHRALVTVDGQPIALAQLLFRRKAGITIALMPRGPLWLADLSYNHRRTVLRLIRKTLPTGRPKLLLCAEETDAPCGPALMTGQTLAELDLTQSPENLRAAMHGKWRNRLVRAEATGLTIQSKPVHPSDVAWLLQHDSEQQTRQGYRSLPHAFLTHWQNAGGKMQLFTARQGNQRIAAMLFLRHAPGATYHIGWSSEQGRECNAHNLILWRAMLALRKTCQRLDLGQIDTVNAAGLARFKLGAGATPRRLGPTRLVLPDFAIPPLRRSQPAGTTRTGTAQ